MTPTLGLKREYGPTLAQLLGPGWRRASRAARLLAITAALALVAGVAALVLALQPTHYSHGGRVPFGFKYRGLQSVRPAPGEYVHLQRRDGAGRLRDSFAVARLTLPPYSGDIAAALPLYVATTYIPALQASHSGVQLRGEGKGHLNSQFVYNVYYFLSLEGRRMYGRDVLLLPEHRGAREGVAISMITAPNSNREVTSPLYVAYAGVLYEPLRSFSFR